MRRYFGHNSDGIRLGIVGELHDTLLKDGLILLRHERGRVDGPALAPQVGHLGRHFASALASQTRMVAIECGMWRSGRKGRSSGSMILV
jgi:hypothetical protein